MFKTAREMFYIPIYIFLTRAGALMNYFLLEVPIHVIEVPNKKIDNTKM